ncbi:hypothetical protein K437DRAFT_265892 [Tilletiaria anomala UBC 951]|uniref:Peroxin/Ferlin domain-containing protein n=1 Tax=Tilletiaria anomala (strain ATCC 24038 / CBS 436.72 / UBC 951) TaxID=1037660 RepID=A0A066WGW0_TILAU|nr:uncharacterized protein K437DRAFT_265892 [Tilletiaria anomala UBC 951]KDN53232.1 hypothetical protein K437DRAFT_265892 [Tilletiaria anomala UBC 951]
MASATQTAGDSEQLAAAHGKDDSASTARRLSSQTLPQTAPPALGATLHRLPNNPAFGSAASLSSFSYPVSAGREHGEKADLKRPLTDIEILSSVPPQVLHLLALLAPVIHALTVLIRLGSWTAGPHTSSASILLLIAWWAVCTYAYPVLRYAPQALPLAAIAWYYLRLHVAPLRRRANKAGSERGQASINGVVGGDSVSFASATHGSRELRVHNAGTISETIRQVEELADFFGSAFNLLLRPIKSLLDWSDPSATLATISFLLVTYPFYLLCFLPWEQLGLPRARILVLPGSSIWSLLGAAVARGWCLGRMLLLNTELLARGLLSQDSTGAALLARADAAALHAQQHWHALATHPLSQRLAELLHIASLHSLRIAQYVAVRFSSGSASSSAARAAFIIPLAPPYPFFSLTISSAFFWLGTLLLTWSSPCAALLRHALWRSALVRFLARRALHALTFGHWAYTDEHGRDRMRFYHLHDILFGAASARTHVATAAAAVVGSGPGGAAAAGEGGLELDPFQISTSPLPTPQLRTAELATTDAVAMAGTAAAGTNGAEKKIERHEDVVYQFSIFENQRWWVGLDWTAALLPQERPSWADEQNNPVSPPPSFSLPPAKLTLTPTPTTANPRAHTRRLVKWQWIDPEWTVAGAGFITAAEGIASPNSASLSASLTSNWSESLRGRFGRSGGAGPAGSPPTSPTKAANAGSSAQTLDALSTFTGSAGEDGSGADTLNVDPDGWQYGDNAWDKMSKKAGLGRYTRRRRWVRRAALVEVVERGYTPKDEEGATAAKK